MIIKDYWPDVIKRLDLMGQLSDAEMLALGEVKIFLNSLENDFYVESATERGLARYEKMLGILPPDGANLEDRRVAILAKLNTRIPYTKRGLEQFLLNLVGHDGYSLDIEYEARRLNLKLDLSRKHQLSAVRDMLRRVLPANMEVNILLRYNQVYMLKRFTVEDLKQYGVDDLRTNGEIKQKFIEKGGVLIE